MPTEAWIEACAHPNIALVKYWGKLDLEKNIPAVPSLSITLGGLRTRTRVRRSSDGLDHFRFQGERHPGMEKRVVACLNSLRRETGFTEALDVESSNDFPTAAGLASSASGFAALVLAASTLMGGNLAREELAELTRRASGSAARSLYGGFVELSLHPEQEPPTSTRQILGPSEWPLEILIAVTDNSPKAVSSTEGMERSRINSPFYEAWVESAADDLQRAHQAVLDRDFSALAEISEHSCLKMHGLMFSTRPGLIYFKAATLECLHQIRKLRSEGCPVFFTVDAGPQVKAICLPEAVNTVRTALMEIPGVLDLLQSSLGDGAHLTRA